MLLFNLIDFIVPSVRNINSDYFIFVILTVLFGDLFVTCKINFSSVKESFFLMLRMITLFMKYTVSRS